MSSARQSRRSDLELSVLTCRKDVKQTVLEEVLLPAYFFPGTGREQLHLCVVQSMRCEDYTYGCMHIHVCIEGERERDRDTMHCLKRASESPVAMIRSKRRKHMAAAM